MIEMWYPLAFMLSPKGLAAAGSGAGNGGVVFVLLLVAMLLPMFSVARSLARQPDTRGAVAMHRFGVGLLDASRLLACAVLLSSWLYMAGYTVNEVFAVWYPNLAASFTMLGVVFCLIVLPDHIRKPLFLLLLLFAVLLFGYLAVMATQPVGAASVLNEGGVPLPAELPAIVPVFFPENGNLMRTAGIALLVLFGVDLAFVKTGKAGSAGKAGRAVPSLITALVLFSLFSLGALNAVNADELAGSTLAHMLVASQTLGDTGRLLMGAVVILGALLASSALAGGMLGRVVALFADGKKAYATRVFGLMVCIPAAVIMATGFAGEPRLELYIAAAFSGWFGAYSLLCLALLLHRNREAASAGILVLHGFSFVICASAAVFVIWEPLHEFGYYPQLTYSYIVLVSVAMLLAMGSFFLSRKRRVSQQETVPQQPVPSAPEQ